MIFVFLESLWRPKEIRALYHLKQQQSKVKSEKRSISVLAGTVNDLEFCYAVLNRVSRSFAAVIQQLPTELRDAVCIFYLVLRGLDSIEDDTSVSKEVRDKLLKTFHEKHSDPTWSIKGVGDSPDYRSLLENYQKVIASFGQLDPAYQQVILDICKEMGEGMAKYLDKEIDTVGGYDEYCHYVAGLVGIGLSRLFSISKVESDEIAAEEELANAMGLFLQKTNIIRDYHEDTVVDRTFWPKEIWQDYGNVVESFVEASDDQSLYCLNHMVTDALSGAASCLEYLSKIRNEHVFRFCAIPQVMAIATLCEVYNNPRVFRENVKIRKGLAAKMIMETSTFQDVKDLFEKMALEIFKKIPKDDPNGYLTSFYLRRLVNKESKIKEIELFSKHRSMSDKHAMAS